MGEMAMPAQVGKERGGGNTRARLVVALRGRRRRRGWAAVAGQTEGVREMKPEFPFLFRNPFLFQDLLSQAFELIQICIPRNLKR